MARLNTRQWNLYKYLKERYAENPNAYVTTKEIIRDLPNDYYFTQAEIENHTPAHDTSYQKTTYQEMTTSYCNQGCEKASTPIRNPPEH